MEFEEDGTPSGILREQSTKVFDEIIPDPLEDPEERERIMTEVLADMSEKESPPSTLMRPKFGAIMRISRRTELWIERAGCLYVLRSALTNSLSRRS